MQPTERNSPLSILNSPIIREVVNFFLFGNFFISFCTLALLYTTYYYAGIDIHLDSLSIFVFSATFFQYNLHRLLITRKHDGDDHPTVVWSRRHPFVLTMLCVVSGGVALNTLFHLERSVVNALIPLGLISIFYELPLVNWHGKRVRLRNLWYFKTIMLVLTWTFVTVLLPFLEYENDSVIYPAHNVYSTLFVLLFLKRLLFMIALAIVFDIRDFDYDRRDNVKTIPVMFGIVRARRVIFILMAMIALVGVTQIVLIEGFNIAHIAVNLLFPVIAYYLINQSLRYPTDYFYSIFVDGIMCLELLLLFVSGYFMPVY
jgi:4-hydroxybenzoate polyprenyltransferase